MLMGDWWHYAPSQPHRSDHLFDGEPGEPIAVCGSDAEGWFEASGPLFPDVGVESSQGKREVPVAELVADLPGG